MKSKVDKLVPIPVHSSKLSDAVENDVAKKDIYNANITNIEDKIPDIANLATKTTLNTKINEVKDKIPNITYLATKTDLILLKKKIPSVSNLVKKKTDYNTNINEIEKNITDHNHDKYITTPEVDIKKF